MSDLDQEQQGLNPEQKVDLTRRKFSGAGLAASGVILTLASKPVMGSNYWCTGSGGMSGNTSSHGEREACLACSPGFWKGSPGSWPTPYYPYRICNVDGTTAYMPTLFNAVFISSRSDTLMSIMKNDNGTRDWHAIAALLNAAKAYAMNIFSAYTVPEIISMYNNGAPASTFSSTYEGNLHNCPLPNDNTSTYQALGLPFCKLIDQNGDETDEPNPACCSSPTAPATTTISTPNPNANINATEKKPK